MFYITVVIVLKLPKRILKIHVMKHDLVNTGKSCFENYLQNQFYSVSDDF